MTEVARSIVAHLSLHSRTSDKKIGQFSLDEEFSFGQSIRARGARLRDASARRDVMLDDPSLTGVAHPQGRFRVEVLQRWLEKIRDIARAELGLARVAAGFNALNWGRYTCPLRLVLAGFTTSTRTAQRRHPAASLDAAVAARIDVIHSLRNR